MLGNLQTLGGSCGVIFAPPMRPPSSEAENLARRADKRAPNPGVWHLSDLVPLGSYLSGLFSLRPRPASWLIGTEKESGEGLRNEN